MFTEMCSPCCRRVFWILFIIVVIDCDDKKGTNSVKDNSKFGHVKPFLSDMRLCKGPKTKNCTEIELLSHGGFHNITFKIQVPKKVQVVTAKMVLWTIHPDGRETADIVKSMSHPCSHFFLGTVLRNNLKFDKNCFLKQGVYVANLNVAALVHDLLGFQFFYGHYRSHTVVSSTKCNIACVVTDFLLQ